MSKRAVVVVDLQNDYWPSGKWPLVGIEAAAANASKVIQKARSDGDAVIHIRHEFQGPQAPFFAAGTEGAEINSAVRPLEGEPVVVKAYPNAFRETGLKRMLDDKGIDEVVLVGAMSHMCIASTARAASDHGYATVVVHDACATRDVEFNGATIPAAQVHAANMGALAFAHGKVVSTSQYAD